MALLDTRVKSGDLTGTLIADLVLQILAYVAQTEREYIHQRQAEGIAAAKEKGKRLGRKPKELPLGYEAVFRDYLDGNISSREAADTLGLCHSTFYRKCREYSEKHSSNSRHFGTPKRH